jgi:[ribosomal protein S5]-alanine N-acetyltransferase
MGGTGKCKDHQVVSVRLVALPVDAMLLLLDGELAAAGAAAGIELTDYFLTDEALWLWRLRIDQIRRDPASHSWIARAAVDARSGYVVGHAGFHGPPDGTGMVEVGYSVDPHYRRLGYAKAMLRELLERARVEPAVRTVRASISPDNAASLATVRGFGFVEVGEQWDEQDGLELILEVPA